jgi:hypothetical protein
MEPSARRLSLIRPNKIEFAAPWVTIADPMKKATVVKNYYVLPCLLLMLNLANNLVSYKAGMIDDGFLRTAVVIAIVLCGGTIVAYLLSPALEKMIQFLHRTSRSSAGGLGEAVFLLALGAAVFWLYYQYSVHGIDSLLPAEWRNPPIHVRH